MVWAVQPFSVDIDQTLLFIMSYLVCVCKTIFTTVSVHGKIVYVNECVYVCTEVRREETKKERNSTLEPLLDIAIGPGDLSYQLVQNKQQR